MIMKRMDVVSLFAVALLFAGACGITIARIANHRTLNVSPVSPASSTFLICNDILTGVRDKNITHAEIPFSVKEIGSFAFANCHLLVSVSIPSSVTSIGKFAFSYCDSLTSIVIPNAVRSIGNGAFLGCCSLTDVIIPDSVTFMGMYVFGTEQGAHGKLTVFCPEASYAEFWCKKNNQRHITN